MLFYEQFLKEILQKESQEDVFKITEKFSNFLVDQDYRQDTFPFQNIPLQNVANSLLWPPFDETYKNHYQRIIWFDKVAQQKIPDQESLFKKYLRKWESFLLSCPSQTLKSHFPADFKKNCFIELPTSLQPLDQLVLFLFCEFLLQTYQDQDLIQKYLRDLLSLEELIFTQKLIPQADFKELNFFLIKIIQGGKKVLSALNEYLLSPILQNQLTVLLKIICAQVLDNSTRTFYQILSKNAQIPREPNLEMQRRQLVLSLEGKQDWEPSFQSVEIIRCLFERLFQIKDVCILMLDEKQFVKYKVREPQQYQNCFVFNLKQGVSPVMVFHRSLSEEILKNFELVNFDDFDEDLTGSDEIDMRLEDSQEELMRQDTLQKDSLLFINRKANSLCRLDEEAAESLKKQWDFWLLYFDAEKNKLAI